MLRRPVRAHERKPFRAPILDGLDRISACLHGLRCRGRHGGLTRFERGHGHPEFPSQRGGRAAALFPVEQLGRANGRFGLHSTPG